VKPGAWLEEPLLAGVDLDPQPAAFALHDMNGIPPACTDLIEIVCRARPS
jgi:hypothetical protein